MLKSPHLSLLMLIVSLSIAYIYALNPQPHSIVKPIKVQCLNHLFQSKLQLMVLHLIYAILGIRQNSLFHLN